MILDELVFVEDYYARQVYKQAGGWVDKTPDEWAKIFDPFEQIPGYQASKGPSDQTLAYATPDGRAPQLRPLETRQTTKIQAGGYKSGCNWPIWAYWGLQPERTPWMGIGNGVMSRG